MNRPELSRPLSGEEASREGMDGQGIQVPVPLGRNRGSQSRGWTRVIVEAHLHCRHIVGLWMQFTPRVWLFQF